MANAPLTTTPTAYASTITYASTTVSATTTAYASASASASAYASASTYASPTAYRTTENYGIPRLTSLSRMPTALMPPSIHQCTREWALAARPCRTSS